MKTAEIAIPLVAVGAAGGYLYYASKHNLWPFGVPSPSPGTPSAPGAPTVTPHVIDANTATADVSWNAVSGASTYNLYVNGQLVKSNINGTSATVTNLVPGTTYQFSVAACN